MLDSEYWALFKKVVAGEGPRTHKRATVDSQIASNGASSLAEILSDIRPESILRFAHANEELMVPLLKRLPYEDDQVISVECIGTVAFGYPIAFLIDDELWRPSGPARSSK